MKNAFLLISVAFFCLLGLPALSFSAEAYEYSGMWPVMKQPWYFTMPSGIAVDKTNGAVYISDPYSHHILKFTMDGQFITTWGGAGAAVSKFSEPNGVAVDRDGYVYVADSGNSRIQKFSPEGTWVKTWGRNGTAEGDFDWPNGIAVDASGNFYVVDTNNNRIQKFNQYGTFVTSWGGSGSGNGQFNNPQFIHIDRDGNILVTDTGNRRVQKFSTDGAFITKWGTAGGRDGQFGEPRGITSDGNGFVYVADAGNACIQKFTSVGQFVLKWRGEEIDDTGGGFNGEFHGIAVDNGGNIVVPESSVHGLYKFTPDGTLLSKWESRGSADGMFNTPNGIVPDGKGFVYVADSMNNRIQKFTSAGQFVSSFGRVGGGNGEFSFPDGLAIDNAGNILVADNWNSRIQKFTPDGIFMTTWGGEGTGDGNFMNPEGIALDAAGNIYVVDTGNHRIQKFTSEGAFIRKWGSAGSGNGQFQYPSGMAVDSTGNVYVADTDNHRIQKFTTEGGFLAKWGSEGSGAVQFYGPRGIAADGSGNVYVSDSDNGRIQKFTSDGQFQMELGSRGSEAGQFSFPTGLAIYNDAIYIVDGGNNRIQLFRKPSATVKKDKAIIVAGGGPFNGNNLWDATQMNANFAYRALTSQCLARDAIYYLSADADLDIDGDGTPDVDADATGGNLQYAITEWAKDADRLILYMVDHGGAGTFRMSETEILGAETLGGWLDSLQQAAPASTVVIYDACESGSFLPELVPPVGKERIVITSSSSGEAAHFLNTGALSFSYFFWGQIFTGGNLMDSFAMARDSIGLMSGSRLNQNPLLDDTGNGVGNEKGDGDRARQTYLGKGIVLAGDIPLIGTITGPQTLGGEASAKITAGNIVATSDVAKVWAVINIPHYSASPANPITSLPSMELVSAGANKYEGVYAGFTTTGTYTITVYAIDTKGAISLPKVTTVEQTAGAWAILSPDLTLHIPIVDYNKGSLYLWVDMKFVPTTDGNGMFVVTDGAVTSPAGYNTAEVSSADAALQVVHIPKIYYEGISLWADLEIVYSPDGQAWFKVTRAGVN